MKASKITSSTNSKKSPVSNTNGKKKANTHSKKVPFNYCAVKIEMEFPTRSKAAAHMLKHTELSQSEIARICGVSQPCVCQLAAASKS